MPKKAAENIQKAKKLIESGAVKYDASDVSHRKIQSVLEIEDLKSFDDPGNAKQVLSSIFKSYDIRGVVIPYVDPEGIHIPLTLSYEIARRIGLGPGIHAFRRTGRGR